MSLPSDKVITDRDHYESLLAEVEQLRLKLKNGEISWDCDLYNGRISFNSKIGKDIPKEITIKLNELFIKLDDKVKEINRDIEEKRRKLIESNEILSKTYSKEKEIYKKLKKVPKWLKWWYNIKELEDDKK